LRVGCKLFEFVGRCGGIIPEGYEVNYYSFHIGDYTTNTAHLTHLEDLAYRRMLDLYYRTENPLGSNVHEIARMVRMSDAHIAGGFDAVKTVLDEFFTESEGEFVTFTNKRCESEIADYERTAKKNRKNGAKGGRPKGTQTKPSGFPVGSQWDASGMPEGTQVEPSHSPLPTTHLPLPKEKRRASFDAALIVIPESLNLQEFKDAWSDWVQHRKESGKRLTPKAVEGQLKALSEWGPVKAVESIRASISNSWSGLFEPKQNRSNVNGNNITSSARLVTEGRDYTGVEHVITK
jgi:uncharacterized protein YdaU (DUF1376 family)